MRIVPLGPPGAGQGIQAGRIMDRFGGAHIATGDILRSNAERASKLGRAAQEDMDRGDLVPDDVIIDMVLERLGEEDCADGFVLDRSPRTVPQAEALERRLELFHQDTAPLLDLYADRGLLVRVDAASDPDEVTGRLAAALGDRRGAA
jgi:adenylate kinase